MSKLTPAQKAKLAEALKNKAEAIKKDKVILKRGKDAQNENKNS